MAHGIEIRMPFMDWRLICFLFSLPDSSKIANGQTKRVAREAMRGRMPERIRSSRVKIGFNSPLPEWLNGPLKPWASDLIHSEHCRNHEWINGKKLIRFFDQRNESSGWNWQNCGTAWKYLNYLWFEKNFIPMNSGALLKAG
jgi:asparagine synthase (glutamine-hydrolysing)